VRVIPHFLLYTLGITRAETPTLPAELEAILRHARGKRRLVEIGVFHGYTTRRLRAVMAPDAVLYAVDPFFPGRLGFSAHRLIARREAGKVSNGTIRWLRCTGAEAGQLHARTNEPPVDFVYLDADNTYEARKSDWDAWSGRLVPGGVVLLHASQSSPTYNIDHAGSVKHTREVALRDPRFTAEETVENLVILRRSRG
jgi:predicted O-methyltransferase YrrM